MFLAYEPRTWVLRARGYRFYFFSREEACAHVHVQHATGEAKLWLDPELEVAKNYGLNSAPPGGSTPDCRGALR